MAAQPFQLLQISDVLDLEFATALAESVPVIAWEPMRSFTPFRTPPGLEAERTHPGSSLRIRKMPFLRGFARPPLSWISQTGSSLSRRLKLQVEDPETAPLICTTPFMAPVAERWPGPVIYWLTDLISEYSSANRKQVMALDVRMCRAATLVCPNSRRIRAYLIERAGCDPGKIEIIPNATRAANLLPQAPLSCESAYESRPAALKAIPALRDRPIAGVIGNLAGNMDWLMLKEVVTRTPWLSWVFVGPTTMQIVDLQQREARAQLLSRVHVHFIGKRPYGELAQYARSFDVAILLYRRCEPTYSGSSTRFYEHLAACRPMIATDGLEELTHKSDFLQMVRHPQEAVACLEQLQAMQFNDGGNERRWRESLHSTWQARAQAVLVALASRTASQQQRVRLAEATI